MRVFIFMCSIILTLLIHTKALAAVENLNQQIHDTQKYQNLVHKNMLKSLTRADEALNYDSQLRKNEIKESSSLVESEYRVLLVANVSPGTVK